MQRVLVAGSKGFIGQAFANYLINEGIPVIGIDRQMTDAVTNMWEVDMLDAEQMKNVLHKVEPTHIFHLAGVVTTQEMSILHPAHVETTKILLHSVKSCVPSARVMILGSVAEYGPNVTKKDYVQEGANTEPQSPYGLSKLAQSQLAQTMADELDLDVICVRLFNTLGPGQGSHLVAGAMVKRLYEAINNRARYFEVFDCNSERDFLDIRDVARLLWFAALRLDARQYAFPIHIASGIGTSIVELAKLLYEAAGVAEAAVPMELMQNREPSRYVAEIGALKTLLHNEPVREFDVLTSLRDMWHWYMRSKSR